MFVITLTRSIPCITRPVKTFIVSEAHRYIARKVVGSAYGFTHYKRFFQRLCSERVNGSKMFTVCGSRELFFKGGCLVLLKGNYLNS